MLFSLNALFDTYHKLSYNCGPQVTFRLNRSYRKSNHNNWLRKIIHRLNWIEIRRQPQRCTENVQTWTGQGEYLLFCSAGVSGGDSVLIKVLFSSLIRDPEYTALSSQMDRILPTDFITLRSPSELENTEKITTVSHRDIIDLVLVLHPCYLFMMLKRNPNIKYITHLTSRQASGRTSANAVR